jgi:acyl-CoA dehydrogenase
MSQDRDKSEAFLARVAAFAHDRVAPGAGERDRAGSIPRVIWVGLGDTGLLRAMLPPENGGLSLPLGTVAVALETLGREGHDPALSIALLPSFILANFHLPRLGTPKHLQRYIRKLVSGECLVALAFSELPHGADPKYLETSARQDGDRWVIDGRKAFVTNGPEADLFVVLAITERVGDRKGFSAFLVDRGTPGLTIEERMPIPIVRAAPHCTLRFQSCEVPEAARIGTMHEVLAGISGTTRTAEDLLGAASFAGHAAWVVSLLAAHRRKDLSASPKLAEALGELHITAELIRLRATRLAELWDRGIQGEAVKGSPSPDEESFMAMLLSGRALASRFAERVAALLDGAAAGPGSDLERAVRDLEVAKIGGAATRTRIRKLGERLAARPGS